MFANFSLNNLPCLYSAALAATVVSPPNPWCFLQLKQQCFCFFLAVLPNILELFQSPVLKARSEAKDKKVAEKVEEKVVRSGRPMFEASMAWATESSPVVYESPLPMPPAAAKTSSKKSSSSPSFVVNQDNLWLVKVCWFSSFHVL